MDDSDLHHVDLDADLYDIVLDDGDADKSEAGVDSLNVSVSAGIMMWHLLHGSGGK